MEEPERVEVEFPKDGLLSLFVDTINSVPGVSLGITLFTPSGMVTGRLIAASQYYDLLNRDLKAHFATAGATDVSSIDDLLGGIRDTLIADSREESTQGIPNDSLRPEFVHMKEAHLVTHESLVPKDGALVRLRIRDISGFFFGEIGVTRS